MRTPRRAVAALVLAALALGGAAFAVDTEVRSFENPRGFSSDVHVIHSDKGNLLIDPGYYGDELEAYVESIGGLDAILISHGHWDNIAGLDACVQANPDAEVYIHELDCPFLKDPVLNASRPNGFDLVQHTEPTTISGECVLPIGGYEVEVIHMPGHTCGSCIFYLEADNALFSGDMFMIPFVGSAKHPTGSEQDRAASIEKFLGLGFDDALRIYPGHRGNTTYGEMLQTNEDLQRPWWREKPMFQQLKQNQNASFCTHPQDFAPVLSLDGKVSFVDDPKTKARFMEAYPSIKGHYGTPDSPVYRLFYLEASEVSVYDPAKGKTTYGVSESQE